MDPQITSALISLGTSLGTSVMTKGAEAPANTLNLVWKATFGRYDKALQNYIDQLSYIDEIKEESKKIPRECIKKDTDISLIGPALEASKYYIENEIIRKMFAKIIAASYDSRKDGMVHHAYIEVIKQLNPLDASIFQYLRNPTLLIYYQLNSDEEDNFVENIFMSDKFMEPTFETILAVSNLERLGLVYIERARSSFVIDHPNQDEYINHFKTTNFYKNLPPAKKPFFSIEQLQITTFGQKFKEICL
ncbi:DUF4393 domain-containing protein [Pectinatus sottacetonis]|uniref:DUF4393 domain-containing protein n=1 Tax=Pectinatus sottacetonis TaxID=1002795 RepID=UPI0018C4677D|nr:DUF4393 domain-containing protein [Pectinatus sottacetonis]